MKRRQTVTQLVAAIPDRVLRDAFSGIPNPEQIRVGIRAKCEAIAGFGVAYHEAFDAANRGEWVAKNAYHFVRAEQQILARLGVTAVYTEWHHFRQLRGTVDASLTGGPSQWGVVENKVVGHVPPNGYFEDIAQLAAYCTLAATTGRSIDQQWAALCYVLPRTLEIRFLLWRDVRPLVRALERSVRSYVPRRRLIAA